MSNNKMLIDASHQEETRVAMVRGNRVDEFDFESEHKTQLRGNIYLAKVTRVEPSLQAAFVDYGGNRHGFLAFSEIHPDYYQIPVADRQALLDADAEDARLEAQAQDDDDHEPADVDEAVPAEEPEKAPRKRRSRRRSKTAKANADETVSNEASTEAQDIDSKGEENDDSHETMNSDNDSDDVVSEPAEASSEEKPKKRRTARRKKTESDTVSAEADAEPVEEKQASVKEKAPAKKRATSRKKKPATDESSTEEATTEVAAEVTAAPKKKRVTSRKKKAEPIAEDIPSEVVTEKPESEETPPKKRRSTRRKKAVVEADSEESASEIPTELVGTDDETASDDAEAAPKEKPTRSRRRSRGKRSKTVEDDTSAESDDDLNGRVEAVGAEDALEEVPTRRSNRRHYKIQEVVKRRQIMLVQVVKEERGNKGAALTTYLSLAGRYSVLMPNTARGGGISRKITNASDRKRLKTIAGGLDVPEGMGVILRTAGASRDQAEVQRDFEYLLRLWENVRTLTLESTAPCLTYEEGSLIKRSIRDLYDKDTGEILVEGQAGYQEAKDFMAMLMPDHAKKVRLYNEKVPLFAKMGVEAQLDAMLQPQVTLKSGGYLVINQTEALVAIDVNSGRSTRQHSIEETATQTNLEAADEVARQLRLRDLAGLIVIDFIDMEERRNNRAVEKRLKDALKNDRARIQVGRISHFGLMEMSRQRIRASVLESTTQVCPTCDGVGHVRAASSVVLGVLRSIEEQLNKNSRNDLVVRVRAQTALYLLNSKREHISELETRFNVAVIIQIDETIGLEPCVVERGELAHKRPEVEQAVQPDTIAPDVDQEKQDDGSAKPEESVPEQTSETKPKRRRRRRRKKGENADADKPVVVDAGQDNENQVSGTAELQAEDATPDSQSEWTEPAAVADIDMKTDERPEDIIPKRRTRRATKTKVAADEPKQNTETEEEAVSVEAEKPATPKRRTTRRKTDDAVIEAPASDTIEPSEPDDKPKKEGWWRRKFF